MGTRVTDAADTFDGAHRPEELREQGSPPGQVAAVGVHVLTEQCHLGHAPAGQGRHFGHQGVEGPAHFRTPNLGDDTEGA